MTNSEFSNEFDVLYQNITSNQAPGLDEYEKSVFLTKAQDEIIKSYFDPRTNKSQEGFDDSSKRQIDFSMLTTIYRIDATTNHPLYDYRSNTESIDLPSDIFMIVNEYVIVNRNNDDAYLQVIPIRFDEYTKLMSKPYKRPLKWQAWRLLNNDTTNNKADIIIGPNDRLGTYYLRYIRRPNPIILDNIDNLTIKGKSNITQCELDPILHQEILQRAVELAKISYEGTSASHIQGGNQSGTDKGYIMQQSR